MPVIYNANHKIIPRSAMARRVHRESRLESVLHTIGFCVCAIFSVYTLMHVVLACVERNQIRKNAVCNSMNDGGVDESGNRLWHSNARAIDFSKEDDQSMNTSISPHLLPQSFCNGQLTQMMIDRLVDDYPARQGTVKTIESSLRPRQ